jgi:Arc/MetJ family transcription regulator
MKTHIELDDNLMEQVVRLGCFNTKRAAVNAALEEYAKLLKRRQLLELRGKVLWEGDLERLRATRTDG